MDTYAEVIREFGKLETLLKEKGIQEPIPQESRIEDTILSKILSMLKSLYCKIKNWLYSLYVKATDTMCSFSDNIGTTIGQWINSGISWIKDIIFTRPTNDIPAKLILCKDTVMTYIKENPGKTAIYTSIGIAILYIIPYIISVVKITILGSVLAVVIPRLCPFILSAAM